MDVFETIVRIPQIGILFIFCSSSPTFLCRSTPMAVANSGHWLFLIL